MLWLRLRFLAGLSLLFVLLSATPAAHGMSDPNVPLTAKEQMQAHHVGDTVAISEVDGSSLRARIVSIGDTSVTVKNAKGTNVEIAYKDVTTVRNGGLSRKATIWIVVGVIFVALSIVGTRV